MRNLKYLQYGKWSPPQDYNGRPLTGAAWDLAHDTVLCTFGPTESDSLIELIRVDINSRLRTHTKITSWDAPCPIPDIPCDSILSLHYFGDSLTACLVLAGGDIVVVREEPLAGEDRIEIVGSVDAGITAAKWSPDEELLAITTKADTVVFMSRSFEGVTDVSMNSGDLKRSNHVSVGWGKKETQFQGKGAKALRDPTMPETVDEGVLSPNDDSNAAISWRGDGAYVAVSTIEAAARRVLRVYSREGVLESVSEPVDGLEGALCWRPAGNLIAGIQRREDMVQVVFFERNGLRHGQFALRLTPEQLQDPAQHITLSWNSDSSVLAVILADCIQLWTMGNYHWYLKQELKSDKPLLSTVPVLWHPERSLQLITAATDSVTLLDLIFITARATTKPPHDFGIVAVIDGQTIKVTPLRNANIPPPMALHEITVKSNVIDIAFHEAASLVAVLHQDGVSVFEWTDVYASSQPPQLISWLPFQKRASSNCLYQQISFSDSSKPGIILLQRDDTESSFVCFELRQDSKQMVPSSSNASPINGASNISMLSSFVQDSVPHPYVQDGSGCVRSLATGDSTLSSNTFPTFLPWVEVVPFNSGYIAFGMSSTGNLYANSRLLVRNCTSFLTTDAHLIFTTTAHMLKFVHFTDINDLDIPPDNPEKDERCRRIERGARLVTAMPTSLSLVLQMPRGNLETIFPRAMVVAGIRKLIEKKDYKKAFTHCRTQRVDLNILYDHAPEQFMSNVALFIDQVKKITYIDLFLSSLREEDVTQTMYKETRPIAKSGSLTPAVNGTTSSIPQELGNEKLSKVNQICGAFLEVLRMRTTTNLQNIITANVCKLPPALEDGLQVVAQLMREDTVLADKAVEHICFLADVNKLYDHALGLYDLDLALLVAQQSQKDPREYLPFLQNLEAMPDIRRQFSIDDHLGRHAKALTHLHTLDDFAALQTYTQKHNLYQTALSLYRYNPTYHATLTTIYAAHLETKSQFKEAGLAYESLLDYTSATRCYLSSGPMQWRETLSSAYLQTPSLSESALQTLINSLIDALLEIKDYQSAATIQLEHLSHLPNTVRTLCKGSYFSDATRLIARHRQSPLLEEILDPALGDAVSNTIDFLADCKSQLRAQVPRILELRAKALSDPLAFYESERGGDGDLPDNISVAASSRLSTSGSLFTRYTGKNSTGQSLGTAGTGVSRATSKNRKREERKRARGKKGSVYEEEYLVNSVERLVRRVEERREEVGRVVKACVGRGMWERGRAVDGGLVEVLELGTGAVRAVWGSEEEQANGEAVEEGGYRAVGGDAVLQESIEAAEKRREPPIIAPFERLSLLGT